MLWYTNWRQGTIRTKPTVYLAIYNMILIKLVSFQQRSHLTKTFWMWIVSRLSFPTGKSCFHFLSSQTYLPKRFENSSGKCVHPRRGNWMGTTDLLGKKFWSSKKPNSKSPSFLLEKFGGCKDTLILHQERQTINLNQWMNTFWKRYSSRKAFFTSMK